MIRRTCARGAHRVNGKMASLYWAWFRADGVRTAWKQTLCVDHAREVFEDWRERLQEDSDNLSLCPQCGGDSAEDLDPIYLTLYAPHQEATRFDLATCAPCAVGIRVLAQENAQRLADRQEATRDSLVRAVEEAWSFIPRNGP